MTTPNRAVAHLRWQADGCRALGSALYGRLLDRCADDLAAGGPTAAVLAGYLDRRRGEVVPLRMLAGVHALVLTGRAPQLAPFYPSVGGHPDGAEDRLWAAFRVVLAERRDEVRRWLEHAPQTNEVGRAAALVGGLCHVVAEASFPLRLVEVGASAGLNLRADRFRVEGVVADHGPPDSPVRLRGAWLGVAPARVDVDVVERTGADIAPIDPTTEDGRLRLTAFVWPDQLDRLARLRGALAVAAEVPALLRTADAVDAVRGLRLVDGTWTVLWHSIFRQYLGPARWAELASAVQALGETATPDARLAHLMLEPVRESTVDATPVTLRTWPGGRERLVGTAPAHGLPVTWLGGR